MKYDIKKLKFGSKINYKGNLYMITDIKTRVIKARKILDIHRILNPYGSVSNIETSIPIKEIIK